LEKELVVTRITTSNYVVLVGSTGVIKHTPKHIMKTDAITAHVGNQARTSIHVIVAADCMLKTDVPTTIRTK
jgi:hypothetical protein